MPNMTDDRDPSAVPPPPGAAWVGDWDQQFQDRIFGADPITVAAVAALLTGVQHRDGSTVSGVALRVHGVTIADGDQPAVAADLTPDQARDLGRLLIALAGRAEQLDGIAQFPAPRQG